jgi:uncharacterized RDD family membrane protein YckC
MSQGLSPAPSPGLARRVLSLVYETLLLVAVLFAGALPFLLLTREADPSLARLLLQFYLLVLCGVYFVWQWLHGGQTLPMKTWRIRLVTRDGGSLALRHGLSRYLFAIAGLALFGIGFLWALIDRDRQFLHDRLAGTRLVKDEGGRMKDEG